MIRHSGSIALGIDLRDASGEPAGVGANRAWDLPTGADGGEVASRAAFGDVKETIRSKLQASRIIEPSGELRDVR